MNYQIYYYNLEGDQDLVIKACDWDSPVDKNGCINVKSNGFFSNSSVSSHWTLKTIIMKNNSKNTYVCF